MRERGERGPGLRQRPLLGGAPPPSTSSGKWMAGTSMRGQSNVGNSAVLRGSVLVSDSVYPLRPWKACRRCSTCRPELLRPAVRGVVPALPVERRLERVLHGQRPALDQEQVRQRRVAQHPGERLDELGQLRGVDVRTGRLVQRHLGELGAEGRVVGQRRVVHAQRGGGEEAEQVEVPPAVAGVDQPGATAGVGVQHQVEAVDEQVPAQGLVDAVRGDHPSILLAGRPPAQESGRRDRPAKCHDVHRVADGSSVGRAGPAAARSAGHGRPVDHGRPGPAGGPVAHRGAGPGAAAGAGRRDPRVPGGGGAARGGGRAPGPGRDRHPDPRRGGLRAPAGGAARARRDRDRDRRVRPDRAGVDGERGRSWTPCSTGCRAGRTRCARPPGSSCAVTDGAPLAVTAPVGPADVRALV